MHRYGGEHQALRRAGLPLAYGKLCVRCGRPMLPGQPIDLDHRDDGVGYRGWSHSHCNRSAGARLGKRPPQPCPQRWETENAHDLHVGN